ncbi:hypothetical protein SAMN05216556_105154 [Aequorivita viscosa]|uniref:Uncharacterized protein n=3 Tax=Flavobacteriales TaxID=200644 RepID=A0A1M6D4T9_9FLAO|nr:hypothetical protein SAMN05216556_105154 [Aequorivita viscosa]SHI68277.1 hypothetical protein SAMN04487908_104154 [Aequorivita viscosa]
MFAKPFWPVMDYMVNYDYIVNNLCENRDKPELNCDGKCYLSKELAKEAGADENNPLNNKNSKTEIPQVIILENISDFQLAFIPDIIAPEKVGYTSVFHTSLYVSKILHPPRIV